VVVRAGDERMNDEGGKYLQEGVAMVYFHHQHNYTVAARH